MLIFPRPEKEVFVRDKNGSYRNCKHSEPIESDSEVVIDKGFSRPFIKIPTNTGNEIKWEKSTQRSYW